MTILMAILVALGVFVGYLVLVQAASRRQRLNERVQRLAESAPTPYSGDASGAGADEAASGVAVMFEAIMNGLGIDVETARRDRQATLARAGITSYNGFIHYLFLKRIGLPILAVLLFIPIFLAFGAPGTSRMVKLAYLIGLVLVGLLGIKGADIYLANRIQKRKQALVRSFPDTLDLLLVCVESGLALDGALARVTRELGRAYPEMTEELNRTRLELTLLSDRSQALQNLAERTDLVPFRSLTSVLIQAERFGTSLADTLRVMSMDYRQTRLMDAENRAGRLPALMTIPMILLMLPAFLMIIIAPPIIRVMAQGGLFGGYGQ